MSWWRVEQDLVEPISPLSATIVPPRPLLAHQLLLALWLLDGLVGSFWGVVGDWSQVGLAEWVSAVVCLADLSAGGVGRVVLPPLPPASP